MNLRKRVEAVIHSDATVGVGWLGFCLSVASELYEVGVRLRKKAYAQGWIKTSRLDCLVVSVGNLTLGGTGKTPMTIYLARLIQSYGYSVVVISRGYKGSSEGRGGVVSDGKDLIMKASACGDEAYMMARALETIPVLMGSDRYAIGRAAIKTFNPQVILLDDGFQHIRLDRDIDIVLLDARKPFGNGRLFPRGILRESVKSISRASAVVLTRVVGSSMVGSQQVKPYTMRKPLFLSSHRPFVAYIVPGENSNHIRSTGKNVPTGLACLKNKRVMLFSGIARNDEFRLTIEKAGCRIKEAFFFGDHHPYSSEELEIICQSAVEKRIDCIITTEKDYSRIQQQRTWPVDLLAVGVDIDFPDDSFDRFVEQRLAVLSKNKTQ